MQTFPHPAQMKDFEKFDSMLRWNISVLLIQIKKIDVFQSLSRNLPKLGILKDYGVKFSILYGRRSHRINIPKKIMFFI